jgi:nucleoporin NUP159
MAFSFANAGRPAFGSSGFGASSQPQGQSFGGGSTGANPSQGPDLEEIQTENIGFQALAGDAKVQLLPSAWPAGALPLPTASLLSIAQGKGLIAAAGPDSVVVASTEAVRTAFSTPGDDVKAFKPQLVLPIGMRVSQVAFSSDESWLAISAEQGGGLAVYDVQTLMEGKTQSAFEMSTDGVSIRALVPNPTPEKAEFFAIVNANGQLVIANMKTRQYVPGGNVKLLKEGVSCVSWSTKGKQLVAGLGDGSAYQMTPEGEAKADIPCPPGLEGQQHGMRNLFYLRTFC